MQTKLPKYPFHRWYFVFIIIGKRNINKEKKNNNNKIVRRRTTTRLFVPSSFFVSLFDSKFNSNWCMGTFQTWRKAYGALKDSTKVGLAKVNSEYKVHIYTISLCISIFITKFYFLAQYSHFYFPSLFIQINYMCFFILLS